MGDISFPNIPQNIRVPLFYADLDPSNANTGQQTQRALIIGQILSSGTGTAGTPRICQGVSDANSVGGFGSMLALMTAAYRARDSFGEVWYLPLADDPSSVAAAGSLNFTSVPTVTGVLSLYIGGQLVSLVVTPTMTAVQIAAALVAQIGTLPNLPGNGCRRRHHDVQGRSHGEEQGIGRQRHRHPAELRRHRQRRSNADRSSR